MQDTLSAKYTDVTFTNIQKNCCDKEI